VALGDVPGEGSGSGGYSDSQSFVSILGFLGFRFPRHPRWRTSPPTQSSPKDCEIRGIGIRRAQLKTFSVECSTLGSKVRLGERIGTGQVAHWIGCRVTTIKGQLCRRGKGVRGIWFRVPILIVDVSLLENLSPPSHWSTLNPVTLLTRRTFSH